MPQNTNIYGTINPLSGKKFPVSLSYLEKNCEICPPKGIILQINSIININNETK